MITASEIALTIGARKIVDDVSFTVAPGESIALVGANGSGKTSVLRCLLGLVPFRGSVRVAGLDVVAEPVAARRRIAWLPQRPAFGDVTAREWLTLVARLRGIDIARTTAVLERVGLLRNAHERARTFSGGMQQRLSLATVLLADADVLLLDEPTTSLDREGRSVLDAEMKSLRARGRTLVIATHRMDEVARWADRAITLEAGRIEKKERAWEPGTILRPLSLVPRPGELGEMEELQ